MKKVLLLSASRHFLRKSTNLLKNQGFQLFTSVSGSEALKRHAELGFDLILSDMVLEDMDGCSFCADVRCAHGAPLVPVILICDDKVDCITKVKQSEASAILLRPINPIHLLNTIGSFLDMQLIRNERVVFNTKVLCRTEQLEFICDSHDISITGIILETGHQLELGSRITCMFNLPNICRIRIEGEVVRGFGLHNGNTVYGIKFMDMAVPNVEAIEAYIAKTKHAGAREKTHRPLETSKNY